LGSAIPRRRRPTLLSDAIRVEVEPVELGSGRHRTLASIGHSPLRVHDCRPDAATTWLRSGLPLGEAAKRLGHSVDILVKTYVGALDDEDVVGNARIERFLDGSSA
jgi:integrase